MAIVETRELTKVSMDGRRLDRLNLMVEEGEIFGLLGPNGAGKSTTGGDAGNGPYAYAGTAWVGGHDIRRHPREVRKKIGVVPQGFDPLR